MALSERFGHAALCTGVRYLTPMLSWWNAMNEPLAHECTGFVLQPGQWEL